MGLSEAKAAKQLNVSRTVLHRGIMRGRLSKSVLPDGTIDIREAAREWVENADPSRGTIGKGTQPGSKKSQEVASTMMTAKAALAAYDAKLAEIAYKKAIGKLVSLEDMEHAIYETARRVRERLQTIPARLAPVVAGLAGAQDECYRAIETEVNEVLDDLAEMRTDPPA